MGRATERNTEPKRTIHHTESGGHYVHARDILSSERARKLISEVAKRLTPQREAPPSGAERTES